LDKAYKMMKNFWKVHLIVKNFWKVHFQIPKSRKGFQTFQKLYGDEKLLESSFEVPNWEKNLQTFKKL